ncbi:MAG TPA: phosphatidylcholine/phosphatidylserine synthase [Terriglobia bacterium]|nr:phosphatidylcholine/phosphatidylserine synthase [Terriglobia bacterium]
MADRRHRRRTHDTARNQKERFRTPLTILPSLFTIGNIFCAYYSVMSTLNERYDQAAIAIGIGYILDGLDGRVARLTGTSSEFGAQLDSLADVLTFGIAPAILAFDWGIGWMGDSHTTLPAGVGLNPFAQHVRSAGWLMTFAFVICGALRLARFNVQAQKPADAATKRFFVGLPIPAGAGLIAAVVHFWKTPISTVQTSLLWCILIGVTAFLMISTVRYHNFKELGIFSRRPRITLVATAMMIALIFSYSEVMLLILAVIYVASGPVARILQGLRRLPIHGTAQGEQTPMEAHRREP